MLIFFNLCKFFFKLTKFLKSASKIGLNKIRKNQKLVIKKLNNFFFSNYFYYFSFLCSYSIKNPGLYPKFKKLKFKKCFKRSSKSSFLFSFLQTN